MKRILFTTLPFFIAAVSFAQENINAAELNRTKKNEHWYASPWVWVAGAAFVIVILVMLSNRKGTNQQKPAKK